LALPCVRFWQSRAADCSSIPFISYTSFRRARTATVFVQLKSSCRRPFNGVSTESESVNATRITVLFRSELPKLQRAARDAKRNPPAPTVTATKEEINWRRGSPRNQAAHAIAPLRVGKPQTIHCPGLRIPEAGRVRAAQRPLLSWDFSGGENAEDFACYGCNGLFRLVTDWKNRRTLIQT